MATAPVISECKTCAGSGHVDYVVCGTCDGYGMIDSDGVRHITIERLHVALSKWAADQGWYFGCPVPAIGPATNRPVIAPRHPFALRGLPMYSMPEMMGTVVPRELRQDENLKIVNTWYSKHGELVCIVEEKDGKRCAYVGRQPCVQRMDMMIESLACRLGGLSARSEAKAFMNLAERLTETQCDSYLLSGAFIETSKRSGVRYIFRKGLPTIALRDGPDGKSMRFLAALCLHPIGFYENTFAGCMAPSDDVLAHLLFMRGDEKKFWGQCNQHPMWALESGI